MDNLNYWPYTDIHELNLDWVLDKVKALDAKLNNDIDTYIQEYIDEHFEDWTVNANYDADTETIVYTNGTGAQQTLGDVIRFAIDNVFVNVRDGAARTDITALNGRMRSAENAISAMPTTILNAIHPIGSEYVTSTPTAPAIGGTWTLIEKEFTTLNATLADLNTYFTPNSTNFSEMTLFNIRRTDHSVYVKMRFKMAVPIATAGYSTAVGVLNLDNLGILTGMGDVIGQVATSYGRSGNAAGILSMNVGGDGAIIATDVFTHSTGALGAGNNIDFTFEFLVDAANMKNSACDRFIWRRTA